jgi:PKD repeat protein
VHERVARPRRSSALSCVFVVVLALALAGSAHAFTVEIVEPEDALCALALGRDYDFEAVAYDSLQQDITSQVTWSWDFGDGSAEDDDNPATHQFDDPATCTVTVTGDWNAQQAQDTVTVQALPEWIADSVLYVRPAGATHLGYGGGDMVFDGEVCDMVEVVWETDEIGIHSARFYVRNGDGSISWISNELQPDVYQPRFYGGQGPDYEQAVSPEIMTAAWFPNQTKTYGVRIGREYGTPDGPEWEYFDRDIAFTSNNTAVAGNTGLIVHKEGSAPHQITWTIEHRTPCAVQEPATGAWSWDDPEFIVTVAILDLWGNVHDTIACGSANGVGAGSTTWNGGTEYGIYTYHISAEHTQVVECSDQDKSPRLTISNVTVADFEWIDLPTTAQVTLGYQLNRASANCRLRVFNHELDEVTVTAPAGGALSNTVGTHSLTVQFEDPDQIVGNYCFVVLADETANDGALNRDEQPKPAVPKGNALLVQPPISAVGQVNDFWSGDFLAAAAHAFMSQTEYPYDPKYATRGCVPTREEALFALETSAVFAFYGHANAEVAVLDGVHNEGLRIEDVKAADLGNLLLIIWGGCKTALGCDNLTTASVSTTTGPPRAAAAVGFEESVITYSLPIFSESFWEQFAGLPQANVDDATYEACWDAWVLTGDEGILSYQVEGDYAVTLAPTRWNGGDE